MKIYILNKKISSIFGLGRVILSRTPLPYAMLFHRAIRLIRRVGAGLVLDTEITRSPALRNLNGSRVAYIFGSCVVEFQADYNFLHDIRVRKIF